MNRLRHAVGAALAVLSGIMYLVTMSRVIIPGELTRSVYSFLELIPRTSPANPLWMALGWCLKVLPSEHALMAGTMLSVCFAVLTVWLVYIVVSGVIAAIALDDDINSERATRVGIFGGAVASIFLAISTPFWMVSTRVHPGSFHLFLLSVCALLFLRYAVTGRLPWLYLLGLVYGATLAELPTAWLFMPVLGFGLIVLMWRHNQLRPIPVTLFLLAGVLGACVYLLAAWGFYASDGYELRGYGSFKHILRVMLTDQIGLIVSDLPRHGWLISLFLTVVPFGFVLFSARRSLNDDRDWSLCLINLVMTGCCLLLLFNVRFSPWGLFGFARILVAPCFLSALTLGVLFSYWIMLCKPCPDDVDSRYDSVLRIIGVVVSVCTIGSLAVAFLLNGAIVQSEENALPNMLAEELISEVELLPIAGGAPLYLVSYGLLDPYIILKARERGLPLRILSAANGDSESYLRYVRTLLDQPSLKRVADAGVMPLVNEMLRDISGIHERVLVQWPVALIRGAGYEAVPRKLFYTAQKGLVGLDSKRLLDEHIAFWSKVLPEIAEADGGSMSSEVNGLLAGQVAAIANDLGMLIEDLGDMDRAHTAYQMSRMLDAHNMSALMNLTRMARDGLSHDSPETLSAELKGLRATEVPPGLAAAQGEVRNPRYYFNRGIQYGQSGQANLAEVEMRRSLEAIGGSNDMIVATLANACLMNNYVLGGREMFSDVLRENPESTMALIGLTRVSVAEGDLKSAKDMLERAKSTVEEDKRSIFALDEAMVALLAGDSGSAISILEESTQRNPSRDADWILLIDLLAKQGDVPELKSVTARIRTGGGRFPRVYSVARLAMLQQDWANAKRYLEEASSIHPENLLLKEELLRACVASGDKEAAASYVRDILFADSGHATANYVLGSLQYARGNAEAAEASFRKSLERERSQHVLNDLAWILKERGALAEAEKLAREALALKDDIYSTWDTLGMILLAKGEAAEALKALRKSYELSGKKPVVALHYAQALLENGEMATAAAVLADVETDKEQLSGEDQKKLKELREKIK